MVGYCSIEDAYGGLPKEIQKEPPEVTAKKVILPSRGNSVEFYDVDGVMDSELGYMVVIFMLGVSAIIIKDIVSSW